MGRLASRESRGTGEQENWREGKGWGGTDCLLIRPDNCRWVRAHLASPCRESPRPHLPSFYLFPFSLPFVRLPLSVFPSFPNNSPLSRSFLLPSFRSSSLGCWKGLASLERDDERRLKSGFAKVPEPIRSRLLTRSRRALQRKRDWFKGRISYVCRVCRSIQRRSTLFYTNEYFVRSQLISDTH